MPMTMRVTALVENTARGAQLLAEHGLAWWIELGDHRVLFDTGQGGVLKANARYLNIPLAETEAVVLSHGHYDHTGGLADTYATGATPVIYAHPAALEPKYARSGGGSCRDIGIPAACLRSVQEHAPRIVETVKPTTICGGLTATGPVPRRTTFEDTGGPFFLDPGCESPDPLADDQALYIDSPGGTIILLGCAHAGVINTIQYVRQLTDQRPVHMLLGGMHLVNASGERIRWTIDQLKTMGVRNVAPLHCTGMAATANLWDAFPSAFVQCSVGTTIEFKVDTRGTARQPSV